MLCGTMMQSNYVVEQYMTVEYSTDVFTINPGDTLTLSTIFNSSDFNQGGDFLGPMVVCAGSTPANQTVTPSTVGVEWKGRENEFQTFCVYHYSLRNDGAQPVSASPIFFND